MKLRSLMTVICVLATATIVSAAPFAYVANSGTRNVTVIDTADNTIKATVPLPDTQQTLHPYAYSVAVSASGQNVYVGLQTTNEIAVIDAARNVVVKRISLGTDSPGGLAVNAAESRLYVTSNMSNTLIVINISGIVPSEVGRVAVENSTISNPEGVVLNPAGNKAYVANSSKGTIAEISLNEVNNVYTRTALIALGSNTQPYGLAISSDGAKLYASSYTGTASVIDTADRTVTDLVVNSGNLSLAITPDNSKIYAPSAGYNNMYWINGANNAVTALGGQNSLLNSPWGSSVAPAGSKLYVAMNLSDNVKVFNASTNLLDTTITLPAGAKPTSMGDFIGPELPFTITATAGGNCTLTPSGTVKVNAIGRKFTAAAASGTCDVRVDGVMQQAGVTADPPYDYTFSNVTEDHEITAFAPTATFNVTANWTGEALGCLEIPFGSGCATKNTPVAVVAGSNVIIKANSGFKAEAWTGACAGTVGDTCTIPSISADKTVGANITVGGGPIYNVTKSIYYQTFAEAIAAASTDDQIKITAAYTSAGETTAGGTAGAIKLSNGWDNDYITRDPNAKMPPLTIGAVGIIVDPAAGLILTL